MAARAGDELEPLGDEVFGFEKGRNLFAVVDDDRVRRRQAQGLQDFRLTGARKTQQGIDGAGHVDAAGGELEVPVEKAGGELEGAVELGDDPHLLAELLVGDLVLDERVVLESEEGNGGERTHGRVDLVVHGALPVPVEVAGDRGRNERPDRPVDLEVGDERFVVDLIVALRKIGLAVAGFARVEPQRSDLRVVVLNHEPGAQAVVGLGDHHGAEHRGL